MNYDSADDEKGLSRAPTTSSAANPKAPVLRSFTAVTGFVHLGSAIATLALKEDQLVPLFEYWTAWPTDADRQNALTNKFVPGVKYAGSISLSVLVAAFFFLSFAFQTIPALVTPIWRWQLKLLVERNVQPFRWLEYSISASVMFLIFFTLNGAQNLHLIVCVFALSFVMMMLGLVSEASAYFQRTVAFLSADKIKRQPVDFFLCHILGWVPFGVLWGLIYRSFVLGINHGTNGGSSNFAKPPSWVYIVFASQIGIMAMFGMNQLAQLVSLYRVRASDFEAQAKIALRSEYIYVALSLTAKSMLAWILFGGLSAMGSTTY
jgi:hypothetical protein